ncbi:uncharacterized protein DSM5745_06989 [Aspergillus mulundensis]|uniref:Uncharacterized protein n=1 Tax=Aspergillus mulundensis TaxID=1810919 RepID=A0A3D8RJV2_9EURO|nr:hypothetical protein DSM5745_06989 [Aspergillus mulundensis]RDW74327.1 hypothetical protein DSM5745_06989 [Aspergillus mulundensis]
MITKALQQAQENKQPVEIVLNEWDGLTSNWISYFSLFSPWVNVVDMVMRIWVDRDDADPTLRRTQRQYFHSFRISHAIKCMNGDTDGASEEAIEFVEKLQEVWASKVQIPETTRRLRRTTYNRNVALNDGFYQGRNAIIATMNSTRKNRATTTRRGFAEEPKVQPETKMVRSYTHAVTAASNSLLPGRGTAI